MKNLASLLGLTFLVSCTYHDMELRKVEVNGFCPCDTSIKYDSLICIAGDNNPTLMIEDSTGKFAVNYSYEYPYYIKDQRLIVSEKNLVLIDTVLKITNKIKEYRISNSKISAIVYCSFYTNQ